MSSKAISGKGVVFQRWDITSSPGDWVNIAEVSDISGPSKSRETIEVTNFDSADGYKEFIAGFRDPGTVSLSMNFTHDSYDLMNQDFENDARQNYRIVLPNTERSTLEFEGLVTELPLAVPIGDKVTCDVTIQVSGKVTFTEGDSSVPSI